MMRAISVLFKDENMLNYKNLLLGAALGFGLANGAATGAIAQAVTADTVIATVGETEITAGEMRVARQNLPAQFQTLTDAELFDGILRNIIQQVLLVQALEEITIQDEITMAHDRRSYLASASVEKALEGLITDESLQAAYDKAYSDIEPSTEYNASHILVETQEEAAALVTELEAGADFAQLARDKSTGPSGPNGGNLGWFGPGMMVQPFEEAVMTLETGQISAPVETQFGWHVVKLNETRSVSGPAMEDVQEQLAETIRREHIEGFLASLTEAANITQPEAGSVDPSFLSDTALFD